MQQWRRGRLQKIKAAPTPLPLKKTIIKSSKNCRSKIFVQNAKFTDKPLVSKIYGIIVIFSTFK